MGKGHLLLFWAGTLDGEKGVFGYAVLWPERLHLSQKLCPCWWKAVIHWIRRAWWNAILFLRSLWIGISFFFSCHPAWTVRLLMWPTEVLGGNRLSARAVWDVWFWGDCNSADLCDRMCCGWGSGRGSTCLFFWTWSLARPCDKSQPAENHHLFWTQSLAGSCDKSRPAEKYHQS